MQEVLSAWIHPYPQGWESQTCQSTHHASPDNKPVLNYCKMKTYIAHYTHMERLNSEGSTGGKLFYNSLHLQWSFYFSLQMKFQLFQYNSSVCLPKQKYRLLSATFLCFWLIYFPLWEPFYRADLITLICHPSQHSWTMCIRDSPNSSTIQAPGMAIPPQQAPAHLCGTSTWGQWCSWPSLFSHLPYCPYFGYISFTRNLGHFSYTPAGSPRKTAILQHFSP